MGHRKVTAERLWKDFFLLLLLTSCLLCYSLQCVCVWGGQHKEAEPSLLYFSFTNVTLVSVFTAAACTTHSFQAPGNETHLDWLLTTSTTSEHNMDDDGVGGGSGSSSPICSSHMLPIIPPLSPLSYQN